MLFDTQVYDSRSGHLFIHLICLNNVRTKFKYWSYKDLTAHRFVIRKCVYSFMISNIRIVFITFESKYHHYLRKFRDVLHRALFKCW